MRLMKDIKKLPGSEKTKKAIAAALAVLLVIATAAWAAQSGAAVESYAETAEKTQEAIEKEYPNLLASSDAGGEMAKEETVYVIKDADGGSQSVTVTEWLKNGEGLDSIDDVSILENIENTANDKTYTQNGNDIVWQAEGSDIKYKGTTSESLPVNVYISYWLDGEKMSASEIAGKSGNVKIVFTYDVKTRTEADGYSFVTPYTMASGVLLNDEHFSNISVEGGKVVDDGNNCICLGIAFPGMTSNLNTDLSDLEIPEKVVIKAYTDNFEIDGTYTVVLSGLLSELNLDGTDSIESKVDELESALDKLGDASEKLVNGADQLNDGAYALAEGASELSDGASSIKTYTTQLSSGLSQISENSDDLQSGAKQVFETLLNTAKTQLESNGLKPGNLTISNYQTKLKAIIDSLDSEKVYEQALATVTAEVEKNRSKIEAAVTAAVKENVTAQVTAAVEQSVTEQVTAAVKEQVTVQVTEQVTEQVTAAVISQATGMSVEGYEAAVEAGQIDEETQTKISETISGMVAEKVEETVTTQMASDEVQKTIADTVSAQMASDEVQKTISDNVSAQMASEKVKAIIENQVEAKIQELINENMESEEVQAKLAAAEEGAKAVISLKSSLDKYRAFYLGIISYTSAVDKASEGASQLADGAGELKSGAAKLASGASDLYEGTQALYDGMSTFDKDGIQKLISTLDDAGIEELFERLSALADAASQTNLIGGIKSGMSGVSRMIVKTAAVKAS